jgi:hypothetical protein
MRAHLSVLLLLAHLPACSSDEPPTPGPPAHTPEELVRRMDAATDALMALPEHADPVVEVQHVLVGVTLPRLKDVTRTPEEAEALAAEIFGRIQAGEDFDLMVKLHTDDSHPGIYSLALAGRQSAEVRGRAEMVPGFGDVAWRLAVGEVGVARHDPEKSPFGYHLIERLR